MSGNYHVRFLGGKGAVRPLTYPVAKPGFQYKKMRAIIQKKQKKAKETIKE